MDISKHSYNEYTIMNEIADNENISQRELSKKIGLSVGTVNILINKMIKEGMIKMEQVSQKQVMYILTTIGIVEKAKKTVSYLKAHYRAIYEAKEKIKSVLGELDQEYDDIYVLSSDDELGEVIGISISEYIAKHKSSNIRMVNKDTINDKDMNSKVALLYMMEDQEQFKTIKAMSNVKMINLLEKL